MTKVLRLKPYVIKDITIITKENLYFEGHKLKEVDFRETTAWQHFAKITFMNDEVYYVKQWEIKNKK